jgi:hypothetical protein
MRALIIVISFLSNIAHANFMICENDSFKIDVLTEAAQFVEEDGMDGARFDGELILLDKRSDTTYKYTYVFQTYNEFNDYGVYVMAFSEELGVFQAVSLNFASEGDKTAQVSLNIPRVSLGGYNGYTGYDVDLYQTIQEMGCSLLN